MFPRILVGLLIAASAVAADYQVVLKNSGKILHGEFLAEDANSITVAINNAEVTFKKERLDLERMKALNAPAAMDVPKSPGRAPFLDAHGPMSRQNLSPDQVHDIQQAYDENIREITGKIAGANALIAKYKGAPPSAERDHQIALLENEVRGLRLQLEDLKLDAGASKNPEAVRLYEEVQRFRLEALAAEKAYLDASGGHAPQAVTAERFKAMVKARQDLDNAEKALARAMQQTH